MKEILDTFKIEKYAGERKDFNNGPESTYPLKGVTYPVDYGDVEGYLGEDGQNLDLFVGRSEAGLAGYIKVYRPELSNGETKFYIQVTEGEETAILDEFKPVLISHGRYDTLDKLVEALQPFKNLS